MNDSPKSSVRCAVLGMNASAGYSYEYCIKHYPDNAYALANSVEDAQLLLIDVDSPEGRHIAHQHLTGNASGKVPVILSANPFHAEGIFFLRKPASPETLREILDQAAAEIGKGVSPKGEADRHVAGAALAMEKEDSLSSPHLFGSDSAGQQDMFFDPNQYLYGAVYQARQESDSKGRVVELRINAQPLIRVCARSKRVHTFVRDSMLRSIVVTSRIKSTQVVLSEEDGGNWPDNGRTESLESFLWRLAAWTSRGRLPQGIDPNARVKLRHWPNMTRLIPLPHAMQIAALWTSGAYTMATIARDLMISLGDVHVFFCAASAIGLIEIEVRTPGKTAPVVQAERIVPEASDDPGRQSRRGLFGRILARLTGKH